VSFALALLIFAVGCLEPMHAVAQQLFRMPRVGLLFIGSPGATDPTATGFVKGMRDLGYVDGRNVVLEYRYAGGRPERLATLAADLVHSKVDVIVVGGPGPLNAARDATQTIPIVAVAGSDPVAEGWAKTLARPGGNVTGLTVTVPGLEEKRLSLLKEAMPRLTRVAVLLDSQELRLQGVGEFLTTSARSLGVELLHLDVLQPADFERAFRAALEGHAQALFAVDTTLIVENRARIVSFASRERLPLAAEFTAFSEDGILLAYGADLGDLLRRAATHVDRILRGARAGDVPIEQPIKFQLLINLAVARTLGIAVPRSLLLRADRVIGS
jgi:putative ABC transport system substrate-binding protein